MADMMVLFDPGNCGDMNLGFPLSLYVLQSPRQAGGHLCLGHGDLLSLAIPVFEVADEEWAVHRWWINFPLKEAMGYG